MSKTGDYLELVAKATKAFDEYDMTMKRGKTTKHEGDRLHCFAQAQKSLEKYFDYCDKAFKASLAIHPIKQT